MLLALPQLFGIFLALTSHVAFAVRHKGQPASIRRPDRSMRIGRTRCQALSLATLARYHPDRRAVFMLALIDSRQHKRHALPIRRYTRLADKLKFVEVFNRDISQIRRHPFVPLW